MPGAGRSGPVGAPSGVRGDARPRRAVAVCYRPRTDDAGGVDVLLVRSRTGRWTLPGGRVDPGEAPSEAAAREAHEEAGVLGDVDPHPVARVILIKGPWEVLRPSRSRAPVFLLEVRATAPPEEAFRAPAWVAPAEAERRLREGRAPWTARPRVRALRAALGALP